MDDKKITSCPLCEAENCYKQAHHYGCFVNLYECPDCGKFVLDDDVIAVKTVMIDGRCGEIRDRKPCNAVYAYLLQNPPAPVGQPTRSFSMAGEKINDNYPDANISVKKLLEKYPHRDDEYKQYCILKNLYKKHNKSKFTARDKDFAIYFCDGENDYHDREFWLSALTKAGYLDKAQNQNFRRKI